MKRQKKKKSVSYQLHGTIEEFSRKLNELQSISDDISDVSADEKNEVLSERSEVPFRRSEVSFVESDVLSSQSEVSSVEEKLSGEESIGLTDMSDFEDEKRLRGIRKSIEKERDAQYTEMLNHQWDMIKRSKTTETSLRNNLIGKTIGGSGWTKLRKHFLKNVGHEMFMWKDASRQIVKHFRSVPLGTSILPLQNDEMNDLQQKLDVALKENDAHKKQNEELAKNFKKQIGIIKYEQEKRKKLDSTYSSEMLRIRKVAEQLHLKCKAHEKEMSQKNEILAKNEHLQGELMNEVTMLRGQMSEVSYLHESSMALQNQNEVLKNEVVVLKNENDVLKNEAGHELQEKIDNMRNLLDGFKNRLKKKDQSLKEAENELKEKDEEIQLSKETIKQLKQDSWKRTELMRDELTRANHRREGWHKVRKHWWFHGLSKEQGLWMKIRTAIRHAAYGRDEKIALLRQTLGTSSDEKHDLESQLAEILEENTALRQELEILGVDFEKFSLKRSGWGKVRGQWQSDQTRVSDLRGTYTALIEYERKRAKDSRFVLPQKDDTEMSSEEKKMYEQLRREALRASGWKKLRTCFMSDLRSTWVMLRGNLLKSIRNLHIESSVEKTRSERLERQLEQEMLSKSGWKKLRAHFSQDIGHDKEKWLIVGSSLRVAIRKTNKELVEVTAKLQRVESRFQANMKKESGWKKVRAYFDRYLTDEMKQWMSMRRSLKVSLRHTNAELQEERRKNKMLNENFMRLSGRTSGWGKLRTYFDRYMTMEQQQWNNLSRTAFKTVALTKKDFVAEKQHRQEFEDVVAKNLKKASGWRKLRAAAQQDVSLSNQKWMVMNGALRSALKQMNSELHHLNTRHTALREQFEKEAKKSSGFRKLRKYFDRFLTMELQQWADMHRVAMKAVANTSSELRMEKARREELERLVKRNLSRSSGWGKLRVALEMNLNSSMRSWKILSRATLKAVRELWVNKSSDLTTQFAAEKSQLEKVIETQESSIFELNHQIKLKNKKISVLKEQIVSREQDAQRQLVDEVNKLEKRHKIELRNQAEKFQLELRNEHNMIASTQYNDEVNHNHNIEALESQLSKSRAEISDLSEVLRVKEEELKKLHHIHEDTVAQMKKYETTVNNQRVQLQGMKTLKDFENLEGEYRTELRNLQLENEANVKKIREGLEAQIQKSSDYILQLEEKCETQEEKIKSAQKLQEDHKTLESQQAKILEELEKSREEAQNRTGVVDTEIRQQLQDAKSEVEKLRTELRNVQEKLSRAQSQNERLLEKMETLKNEALTRKSSRDRRESMRVDADRVKMYKKLLEEKELAVKTLQQREEALEERVKALETNKIVKPLARHPYLPQQALVEPPDTSPYTNASGGTGVTGNARKWTGDTGVGTGDTGRMTGGTARRSFLSSRRRKEREETGSDLITETYFRRY